MVFVSYYSRSSIQNKSVKESIVKTDVLFVIPNGRAPGAYGPVAKDAIEPPAAARFAAGYLMRRNVTVDLFDANISDQAPDQMAEDVQSVDPALVVIPVYGFNPSSSTQTMPSARAFAASIKELVPHIPILFLGTHPAALPERTLLEEPIDYVCTGEGPVTIHELVQVIKSDGDLNRVRSLCYRKDGGIVRSGPAPLLDLNEEWSLEGWKLTDPRKYRAHNWQTFYREFDDRGPYANPFSSQGCPFHCDFCNIQSPFREGDALRVVQGLARADVNSHRLLRPQLFVEELTYLVEQFGVRYIKIPDEMFGLGTEHVLTIAKMVQERFGDSLNFWCYFRVDTCLPKYLDPLRAAGFRWLALGIEAANSRVRSGQDKRFNDQTIVKVVDAVHAAGLEGALNYIFGLPEDTMESMQATYDMAVSLNSAFANFYCTQALPGSELYRRAVVNKYPLPDRPGGPGWIGYSQYGYNSEPFYLGNALTPAQVLEFRDRAQFSYYQRPEFRKRLMADPKFGTTALGVIDGWMKNLAPDVLVRRLLEPVSAV